MSKQSMKNICVCECHPKRGWYKNYTNFVTTCEHCKPVSNQSAISEIKKLREGYAGKVLAWETSDTEKWYETQLDLILSKELTQAFQRGREENRELVRVVHNYLYSNPVPKSKNIYWRELWHTYHYIVTLKKGNQTLDK